MGLCACIVKSTLDAYISGLAGWPSNGQPHTVISPKDPSPNPSFSEQLQWRHGVRLSLRPLIFYAAEPVAAQPGAGSHAKIRTNIDCASPAFYHVFQSSALPLPFLLPFLGLEYRICN